MWLYLQQLHQLNLQYWKRSSKIRVPSLLCRKYPILFDELENLKSTYYTNKKTLYFTIKSYENLGKNILVSLLDLFELNPASRIPHTPLKNLNNIKE